MSAISSEVSFDQHTQQEILARMIFSDIVLARISSQWSGPMFGKDNKYANVLGDICVNHHKRYGESPKRGIVTLIQEWLEGKKDSAVDQVEGILSPILDKADDYSEKGNTDRFIDCSIKYFTKIALMNHCEELKALCQSGNIDKASILAAKPPTFQIGSPLRCDPFRVYEDAASIFEEEPHDPLVKYDDDFASFFGPALEREAFVAFLGSQKSGKSFFLVDLAYRAILNRKKVAYFQIGDLSLKQVKKRFMVRNAAHPIRNNDNEWPCTIKIPVSITAPGEGKVAAVVKWKDKEFDRPLSLKKMWESNQFLMNKKVKTKDCLFNIDHYVGGSVSILDIRNRLDGLEREGFIVDVVVIDYADNLAPMDRKQDKLEQENQTWLMFNTIAKDRHCLVATATQCNRAGFSAPILLRQHVGQNNQKLNHVTGLIGINMTASEKEQDVRRLNWVVSREQEFSPTQILHVAGCLAIGNPTVVSARGWKRRGE